MVSKTRGIWFREYGYIVSKVLGIGCVVSHYGHPSESDWASDSVKSDWSRVTLWPSDLVGENWDVTTHPVTLLTHSHSQSDSESNSDSVTDYGETDRDSPIKFNSPFGCSTIHKYFEIKQYRWLKLFSYQPVCYRRNRTVRGQDLLQNVVPRKWITVSKSLSE